MRSSLLFPLLLLGACGPADGTRGSRGNAELAFVDLANQAPAPIDRPLATGTQQTVRVRLLGDAKLTQPTFSVSAPALRASNLSRGSNPGEFFIQILAASDGKATLTLGDPTGQAIDTFELEASSIKSFAAPGSVDLDVNVVKTVEVTAEGADKRKLRADGAVSWVIDPSSVAKFVDPVRGVTRETATGIPVLIKGANPGKATLRGSHAGLKVDVPITVR